MTYNEPIYIGLSNEGKEVEGKGYERRPYELGEEITFGPVGESWGTITHAIVFLNNGDTVQVPLARATVITLEVDTITLVL